MSLLEKVQKVIDTDIAQVLSSHGGSVKIKSIEDGVVTVTLGGNCSHCPSAQLTTETIVKEQIINALGDEVKDVKLNCEVSDELWQYAKEFLRKK